MKKEIEKNNSKPKVNKVSSGKISHKNYIYAVLVLLGGILIALYIFEWVNVKKEEKLMNSYLLKSNTINSTIELDSINQTLSETPSSYFIFLSVTGDETAYEFEKNLKRIIDNYDLNDLFYYVDVTDLKNNNPNYLKEIKKKLNVVVENVPALIYVHEGKLSQDLVLDGVNGNIINIQEVENLLDVYDYEIVK